MLVRADAIPVVEMIKAAEAVDAEAAALWLHMGLWDALGEMIDDARPEIDAVWKSVVAAKSDRARGILVRQAIERRIDGGEIDDVVKAAAGLSIVRGYVAKEETAEERAAAAAKEPRDQFGRWTKVKERQGSEIGAYDAMGALTHQANPKLQGQAESVAEQLKGSNYDRMRVLGNGLVATGHPKAMAAGGVVRVAAEVGPSAEDVLGTHLRRAAYRYRGTEKRPDRQLVRETKETTALLSDLTSGDAQTVARAQHELEQTSPGEWGKGSLAARLPEAGHKGWSDDTLEMRATGDVSTAYLMRQLPTQDEALLSQEAGRTPPSVGVLIDRDGDVVSEAMGYQGDHYVPFDLKNLKRLQGGSYVRTRALGGPTTEDIYTGLLTGARQLQVVSRSGVFTIEFDPDLRGGRRYSDKARQMVDRYGRLLDVVGSGERTGPRGEKEPFYTQDIPDDRKRELRAQAMEAADYDEDEARLIFNRSLRHERAKSEIGYTDEELRDQADREIDDWITNQRAAGRSPTRTEIGHQREIVLADVRDKARERKQEQTVRRLRLNAEGYYRAMQSLRREFPYYIRDVDYEPLPDFESRRRTRAPGEPRAARAAAASEAKRTHVARGSLVPAEQETAYPRIKGRTTSGAGSAAEGGEGETVGAPKTPEGGAPGAAGAAFADTLKSDRFQEHVALSARVLRLALEETSAGPVAPEMSRPDDDVYDEKFGRSLTDDRQFVAWLVHRQNTLTHGTDTGIARYLTEKASPEDLLRVKHGMQQMAGSRSFEGEYAPEKIEAFQQMLSAISGAREPFAKPGGAVALHKPDLEDPKPYPHPEVIQHIEDSDEKFDKQQRLMEVDPAMKQALAWAAERSNDSAAAALRKDVNQFEAAVDWAKKRQAAKKAGELMPAKPTGVEMSGEEADAAAENPESSPDYRTLKRRQLAWAWIYTRRLRDSLRGVTGDAGPKAIEKSARWEGSRRQVVYLREDDPFAKAFQRRLRQATGRGARR